MQTKCLDSFFIFLLGLGLFTVGLHSQEIISFEARFYLFVLEIWRHGANWFPTTYQHPYPDYPVTSTYLIYLASTLFGGLNKFTAVLPSAIASAITLVMTYLIGASYNRRWGWCAVLFLLFTMTFIIEARTISLDQYVTMVTVVCFYLVSEASFKLSIRRKIAVFFLLVFSFAIRGPLGIVIPAGVVCASYLMEKRIKSFFIFGFSAAFLLIVCSALLLGLAYHVGGSSFVQDVIRMQIGSRIQDVSQLPVSFYFTESFGGYAITYPLAIFILILSLSKLFSRNASPDIVLLRKCLGWAIVIIVGLSIPADKKMRYILPFAPALSLMCGYLFIESTRSLNKLKSIFKGLCFIFPMIALAVLFYLHLKKIQLGVNYPILSGVFILLQLGMLVWRKREIVVLALATATFFIANVGIVETINLHANLTRDFVLQLELMREKAHSPLVFFQEGSDGLPIKYLVNMQKEEIPLYLVTSDELVKLNPQSYVIVGEENVSHISAHAMANFRRVMQGKIGHDKVVVLQKR